MGDLKTKNDTPLSRLSIIIVVLMAWVGSGFIITFGVRPPRSQPVSRPNLAALPPTPPSLIVTQFVVDGPLTVATQALNGSLVVVTQFAFPTIQAPARYYVAGSEFPGAPRSLDLMDFRFQPDFKSDDLK